MNKPPVTNPPLVWSACACASNLMNAYKLTFVGTMFVSLTLLTGCYVEPADEDVVMEHDQLPPGPGLFTGSEGSYTIYGGSDERKRKRF